MASCEDLNSLRKRLEVAMGDNAKQYFHLMKLWFQLKTTKQEFDAESRKLMTPDQIHLHNQFLLCLFTKCQSLALYAPSKSSEKITRKTKLKRRNRYDKASFEPADMSDYIMAPNPLPPKAQDEPLRYSAQELFLPDMSLIFGRMLLAAWEVGLEGAEESAAELLVTAVQHLLKNVLTAVMSRRKGYKLREGCFLHGLGSSVPNPWLHNTTTKLDNSYTRLAADTSEEQSSTQKLTLDEIEQQAAFEIACSDPVDTVRYPVTSYQVLEALQVHRNVIPSHSLYAINIERVITMLNHPAAAAEEVEAEM